MSIRYLDFPLLVQKRILRNMELINVIIIYMMSKRAKRALDTWKCPIDEWSFSSHSSITLSKGRREQHEQVIIRILPKKENEQPEVFKMQTDGEDLLFKVEKPVLRYVNGRSRGYEKIRKINVYSQSGERKTYNLKIRLNELLCRLFLGIFNPLHFGMYWNETIANINSLFIWKLTQTFKSIWIVSRSDTAFSVTPETIKFLLEEVTADVVNLDLMCTTKKFKYVSSRDQVSKIKQLVFWKSDFLQFDNFIHNLNRPHLKCAVPGSRAMNVILKEWIRGDNDVILDLTLNKINMRFVNKDVALREIATTPSAFHEYQLEARTGRYYREFNIDNSMDIRRNRDDRQATLFIERDSITLHVWTDEDLEKVRNLPRSRAPYFVRPDED